MPEHEHDQSEGYYLDALTIATETGDKGLKGSIINNLDYLYKSRL